MNNSLLKDSEDKSGADEKMYFRLSLKHTILSIVVTLVFMAICWWMDLIIIIKIALFPLSVCIFNIFLTFKKKYTLALYLGLSSFAIALVLEKYYLANLPIELFFIPMIIGTFSIIENIKWIRLSFIILSILFGLAHYIGDNSPNAVNISVLQHSLFVYVVGVLVLALSYQILNNYFITDRQNRRDILEQKDKIEEQNEELKVQHENIIALEREKRDREIELKRKDIETLQETNRLKLKIRAGTIAELQSITDGPETRRKINLIIQKLKQQIDTEIKIEKIQEDMEAVNSQFIEKLILEFPQLTKTEREICSFIKLGLSSKEMAALRNSNVNAIDVAKARIRKKMNISSSDELSKKLINL